MDISLQIKSLLFSFFYGFLFAFIVGLFYKLLYSKSKIIRLITSLFLILLAVIIYFLELKKINNAIFHIYEIISIIVGYTLETLIIRKINIKAR